MFPHSFPALPFRTSKREGHGRLYIQISDIQRIVFDELPPGLHDVSHQHGEHLVCLHGVVFVQTHPEQSPARGIHRRFEQLFGVHLSQSLVALDVDAAFPDFEHLAPNLRNAEDGVLLPLFPFPFRDFEQGRVLGGEWLDHTLSML